ncbi:MAG TPA: Uma2 family endonuclease [Trichormus sp.]|jgi:Uma2 family endonuclease
MSLPAHDLQLSQEDYLELEEKSCVRHEFVNGRAFAMVGGTEAHDRIVTRLTVRATLQLGQSDCRVLSCGMKLRIAASGNFYYPDLMVSCEPYSATSLFKTAPCLIFEVLSPSTQDIDRREKLQAYQSIASLSAYAMFAQDERRVEVYKRTGTGWTPTIHTESDLITLVCAGDLELKFSLDAIYEGVFADDP